MPVRHVAATAVATFLLLAPCLLMPVRAADNPGVPEAGALNFEILRNGNAIGRHVIRFEKNGDDLEVRVEAKVDYRFGFIPLYRFEHRALEVWRDGNLLRMSATTNDNGADYRIDLRQNGAGLVLTVNDTETVLSPDLQLASLWNIALVKQNRILDPADGELMSVTIADAGADSIQIDGRDVATRHYVMTGDFERELWYDARNVLRQVRFHGDDGSEIRYALR